MLTTFPQSNSSLEFPEILSQNLLCYHWLSVSGNSKTMHCGILINMPYSEFYQWLRMSGFLLFCFNIHEDSLAEFHSMTVHDETNIALIIAKFNCLCLLNLFRMASCYETFNLIKHNSLWKPHCGFRIEQNCNVDDG